MRQLRDPGALLILLFLLNGISHYERGWKQGTLALSALLFIVVYKVSRVVSKSDKKRMISG